MARKLGNRIAPPRFILYALALLIVAAWAATRETYASALLDFLIGFDIATLLFFMSLIPLFRTRDPKSIGRHASQNDANRVALLIISVAISAVVFGAVAQVVTNKSEYSKALVIVTLAMSWVFVQVIYALHYAHLYYSAGKGRGGFAGGLSIPSTETPDYSDFLHFSLILGMTFQTADIDITSTAIRRVSTWHCLEAFVFNIGILAFSINMIASN
ncbi:MAG: DUF1345 domain-containing protein [Proteobacteria bacterium]|nr:DUF1345 domain-containing protein [Pseudomonadota bacterium]